MPFSAQRVFERDRGREKHDLSQLDIGQVSMLVQVFQDAYPEFRFGQLNEHRAWMQPQSWLVYSSSPQFSHMQSRHMHSQPSRQEHESGMVSRGQQAVLDCW